jgi:hypothetical protein
LLLSTKRGWLDEWKAGNMEMRKLRMTMWLVLAATVGLSFFMAYSWMVIAAAIFFFLIFLVLACVIGFKNGSIGRRAAWGDSSRKETWKTK